MGQRQRGTGILPAGSRITIRRDTRVPHSQDGWAPHPTRRFFLSSFLSFLLPKSSQIILDKLAIYH
jgi:hypothetical protein